MNARVRELRDRFDALAIRERALVLFSALAVLFAITDNLLLQPFAKQKKILQGEILSATEQLSALENEIRGIAVAYANDPSIPLRAEESRLEAQIAAIDEKLEGHVVTLVPPQEMTRLLEALLDAEEELEVVRAESRTRPSPLGRSDAGESGETQAPEKMNDIALFEHGIVVELEGTYPGALRFLEAAEQLRWSFFWDRLEYEVREYPEARMTIELHTLSEHEEWIGV